MWLQQRLKGLPGLLSSSWARRLLCLLGLLLLLLWFAGSGARRAAGGLHLPPWARGEPGAAESSACLEAATRAWRGLLERGEAVPLGPGVPALVANGFLALDVTANRLWVTPGEREPAVAPDFVPFVQLRPLNVLAEAGEAVLLPREGLLRRVRCLQLGSPGSGPAAAGPGPASASGLAAGSGRDCVLLQEDFLAHRGRPHVYLQRIQLNNPTERVAALQTVGPTAGPVPKAFTSTLEKIGDHQFLLYSGRSTPVPTGRVHLVVVAAKKLVNRLQVAPKTQLDETVLWVVYVSGPINPQVLKSKAAKELKTLQDLARREMLELLEVPAVELLHDHQRLWAQLFSPGVEMKKITDAHTPSGLTVNLTLYYMLSCSPAPLLSPSLSHRERDQMEATLNYEDHCFSGHATMHAENLWPARLASVQQILQLSDLWKLTLQKRGCKGLVKFQADPDVLHNSYALRGIRYKNDHIDLAVLADAEGKPYLHVSVESRGQPVKIYACEAGCLDDPVELTAARGGPHLLGHGDAAHHAAAVHLHRPHAPAGPAAHAAPQGHPGARRAHGPAGPRPALPLLVQRGLPHHPLPPLPLQAHLQRVLRAWRQAPLQEQGRPQCLRELRVLLSATVCTRRHLLLQTRDPSEAPTLCALWGTVTQKRLWAPARVGRNECPGWGGSGPVSLPLNKVNLVERT
uniref:KIAA2013 n=1 Tax=Sciurus vulgaris TaxID=55149 RepID=A0A8D2CNL6_SCIVU